MRDLIIDCFAGGGGASVKPIDVIKKQIQQGILTVNRNGEFWKLYNKPNHGDKLMPIKPRRMETKLKNGYLGIAVWENNKQYLMLVHRAVWEIFRGPIPDGYDINHINGEKHDNRLENLEVVTRSQNLYHAIRTGLKTYSNYSQEYSSKAKALRSTGMSFTQIGKALGISQTTAFKAVKY